MRPSGNCGILHKDAWQQDGGTCNEAGKNGASLEHSRFVNSKVTAKRLTINLYEGLVFDTNEQYRRNASEWYFSAASHFSAGTAWYQPKDTAVCGPDGSKLITD